MKPHKIKREDYRSEMEYLIALMASLAEKQIEYFKSKKNDELTRIRKCYEFRREDFNSDNDYYKAKYQALEKKMEDDSRDRIKMELFAMHRAVNDLIYQWKSGPMHGGTIQKKSEARKYKLMKPADIVTKSFIHSS